ncbi:Uncharacterized protein OBRU01_06074 [Operophtera brumata]|uniref:Regulatory protein zeste n=1 Tax=Operophtera brumata TaxID=104452 RepID=A0A0L7LEH5_OPEBR|nr:Uncharacterized protein OBRU01_06074 [Operophtera brumata]
MEIFVSVKKEQILVKEENLSDEQFGNATPHYMNQINSSIGSGGLSVKEEVAMKDESTAEEEHFIEISPNNMTTTDHSSNEKAKAAKALTPDETRGLLELIRLHPVITSKGNNATNNRQKILVWDQITDAFNATCGAFPRTSKQLRLKWENLKKNARRRSSDIRSNRGKRGDFGFAGEEPHGEGGR